MKLILGSFYPYTQKPTDYQPYRPVYLFRGPPPDAGFSYGLFEDPETGRQYYAELGLEPFSPLSGKYARLVEELSPQQLERLLGDDLKKEYLEHIECEQCGSKTVQNMHFILKDREFWCHCCGARIIKKQAKD